jgi:hypothetical protein
MEKKGKDRRELAAQQAGVSRGRTVGSNTRGRVQGELAVGGQRDTGISAGGCRES